MTPEQKRNNRRMGLTLASIAVVFFFGFIVRMVWFSGR
ncbi:cytochrome oxidase small assembly protein [Variovorax sp. YR566]